MIYSKWAKAIYITHLKTLTLCHGIIEILYIVYSNLLS